MASLTSNTDFGKNREYSVMYGYKDVNDFVAKTAKGLCTELGTQAYKVMYDKVNESIYGSTPETYVHSYGFLNAVTLGETHRVGNGWSAEVFIDPYVLQQTAEPRSQERGGWTVHQSNNGDRSISQMNMLIEMLESGGGELYEHKAHGFIQATKDYLESVVPHLKTLKDVEGISKGAKYGRGYTAEGDFISNKRGMSMSFNN